MREFSSFSLIVKFSMPRTLAQWRCVRFLEEAMMWNFHCGIWDDKWGSSYTEMLNYWWQYLSMNIVVKGWEFKLFLKLISFTSCRKFEYMQKKPGAIKWGKSLYAFYMMSMWNKNCDDKKEEISCIATIGGYNIHLRMQKLMVIEKNSRKWKCKLKNQLLKSIQNMENNSI